MIPVLANGFEDLNVRGSWQDEQISAQQKKLQELVGRISRLTSKQDLEAAAQLGEIQRQQLKLSKRIIQVMQLFKRPISPILQIMRKMEVSRKIGQPLTPAEEELRIRLHALLAKYNTKGSSPLEATAVQALGFQMQALKEAGRLDPLRSARTLNIADPQALASIENVERLLTFFFYFMPLDTPRATHRSEGSCRDDPKGPEGFGNDEIWFPSEHLTDTFFNFTIFTFYNSHFFHLHNACYVTISYFTIFTVLCYNPCTFLQEQGKQANHTKSNRQDPRG